MQLCTGGLKNQEDLIGSEMNLLCDPDMSHSPNGSVFNLEFQAKFGIQLGISVPMGINL